MSDTKMATDLPVQSFEPEVSCGPWCQGGQVGMKPTDLPQYTEAGEVWVRGDEVLAQLAERDAEIARLREGLAKLDDEYCELVKDRDAERQRASWLTDALTGLIDYASQQECTHDETHRGGTLWTICDQCGRKWADDEGGFVEYKVPEAIANARRVLAAVEQGEQ